MKKSLMVLFGVILVVVLSLFIRERLHEGGKKIVKSPPVQEIPKEQTLTGFSHDASRLSLSGAEMIDPDGHPIVLRGFNWGSWWTAEAQDAVENKAQWANVVRIPLRWWWYYDSPLTVDSRDDASPWLINPENLKVLDAMITQASDAGLWIVLFIDSNCGQNGTQEWVDLRYCDPTGTYGDNGHNFWTDREMRKKYIEVWKYIAARYKDTPYIGMYELLPEPSARTAKDADVREFYQEIIDAVYPIDPETPFLIWPGGGYSMKKMSASMLVDTPANVVYTSNLFVHPNVWGSDAIVDDLRNRLWYMLRFRDANNVPVFIQQTGSRNGEDPDMTYAKTALSLLRDNRIWWTWWTYRQDGTYKDGYGIYYQQNSAPDGWSEKTELLQMISGYFRDI
jgi:aryl-phospho-beta-D-glucosidase BglC (GH1 family)